MINPLSTIYFIFSIFTAVVAFLVLSRRSKSQVNVSFSFLCLSVSVWLFSFAVMYMSHDSEHMFLWSKIGFIGLAFIAVLTLRFVYAFSKTIINERIFHLFYLLSFAAVLLNFTTNLFYTGMERHFFGYYPKAGVLYFLIPLQAVLFIFLSFRNLNKAIRKPDITAHRHKQIRNVHNALWLMLIAVLDHLLAYFNLPVDPLAGALCSAVFVTVVIFTLGRYSMADIKIIVSRTFIFLAVIAFILVSSYFVWKYTRSWGISTVLTLLLSVAGTYFYRAAIDKTEDLILAEQKKYQSTLMQAASGMAREHELKRLLKLISIMLIKTVKVSNVAIYLENSSGKLLECEYLRPSTNEILFPYSYMNPFVTFMKNKGRPFTAADLPLYILNSVNLPFKPALIIPFFFDNGTNGFIVLGPKKNKKSFNREDIILFKTLSRQTSLAIENCVFFEEFKNTQEKVFTAEKLASVGGLAEGVAHQINNRLNQFSMISAELKFETEDIVKSNEDKINSDDKFKKSLSYISELADSLAENIKRTDAVIKGILNYTRAEKQGNMFSEFSLTEVFDLAMELLKLKHKIHKDFRIEFDLQNNDDKIYGIRSQIMESVYNTLDNAYEATMDKLESLEQSEKQDYKPLVKIALRHMDDKNVFSLEDNGIGIKEENLSKISAPFFTTKSSYKSGTGIGLYIVRRMIEENHKGKMYFESTHGKGTKITFELPK